MCGIAGIVGPMADRDRIQQMSFHQHHRGPDYRDSFLGKSVALGHTRLCVLDPSEAGHQPMESPDGRFVLIYNGEIYNFRELRGGLRDRGYDFRSDTDTETVLHAWAEWRYRALERFEGMFAFAVWDREERRLSVARDRLGIKPLYWYHNGKGTLLFASEVRALLASGLVDRVLNGGVLPDFMSQQTAPAPHTLIREVRMLPPGSWFDVNLGGEIATPPAVRRYWDPFKDLYGRQQTLAATSEDEALRGLRRRLHAAVEARLVADVPLGAFLSGGLDSTAVVALMDRVSSAPVRTFTVAFEEAGYDDGIYARIVAEQIGTDHTEIRLSDDDLVASIPCAVAAQDHPSGDGINTWIVSRAVKEAGLTVALSGLGGDELFGGYSTFRRLALLGRIGPVIRSFPRPVRTMAGRLLRAGTPGVAADKLSMILETDGSVGMAYPVLRQVFDRGQVQGLLAIPTTDGQSFEASYTEFLRQEFVRSPRAGLLARVSIAEITCYMRDVLLRDADQMSMAHALEVRVPFLDREVVEYTLALPEKARAPSTPPKRYLVRALRDLLPEPVVERRKSGFAMPFDRWMRGPLRGFCEEGIGATASHPAFQAEGVRDVWRGFLRQDPRLPWSRAWLLVALGHWLERERIETVR